MLWRKIQPEGTLARSKGLQQSGKTGLEDVGKQGIQTSER